MTMQPPSNMPGIVGAPLLGQREQQARAQIMQAVQQLSLGIYSHLAVSYIAGRDQHQPTEREQLEQLARDSQAAAQAYFEGLGIAQFQEKDSN